MSVVFTASVEHCRGLFGHTSGTRAELSLNSTPFVSLALFGIDVPNDTSAMAQILVPSVSLLSGAPK